MHLQSEPRIKQGEKIGAAHCRGRKCERTLNDTPNTFSITSHFQTRPRIFMKIYILKDSTIRPRKQQHICLVRAVENEVVAESGDQGSEYSDLTVG